MRVLVADDDLVSRLAGNDGLGSLPLAAPEGLRPAPSGAAARARARARSRLADCPANKRASAQGIDDKELNR